jgi:DNA-binding CsgD family transcriptional regulator
MGLGSHIVPELAEAAARTGDLALVEATLKWLSERTRVTPTDWVLGIEARVRALLCDGDAAESCYQESIERLGRTRVRAQLARAHLLYGEWLRRKRRRGEAREQLRTAYEMLDAMGIGAFAERARRELQATGETARKRTGQHAVELTAQEAQVARLAREGLSNPEIGARLFISARTVQYHLGKVFTKLGISSRSQLSRALPGDAETTLWVPRTSSTLCDQAILVDLSTSASLSSDAALLKIDRFGQRFQRRRPVLETVRPVLVVVVLVIAHDLPQMALVPGKDAVRELASASPDPAFGNRVHAGRPHVAQHGPDPGTCGDRVECGGEVRATVVAHSPVEYTVTPRMRMRRVACPITVRT